MQDRLERRLSAPLREGPGGIRFELHRSARRRTLSIEVHPDLRVVVRAPARASDRFVDERVSERQAWIRRTLERLRRSGHAAAPPLRWLAGETHDYLGDAYRLEIVPAARDTVALEDGCLLVGLRGTATPGRSRQVVEAWYRERLLAVAATVIGERFDHFAARGHRPPALRVRRMRSRWGSLVARRRMTLNLALVHAPLRCVEYVVVHELCHLEQAGHGAGFYRLLGCLLPDWRERKALLAGWPVRLTAPDSSAG